MNNWRRFRLLLNVLVLAGGLILAKTVIHELKLEFLSLDSLFSSVVAGTIFIIGFLLTSLLPDFKEAERAPAEIRAALEAIHDDVVAFALQTDNVDVERLRTNILSIVSSLETALGSQGGHSYLETAIAQADQLAPYFSELERLGMSQNFVVRIRSELDVLRRCLYRIHYIQKIEFLPSVHVLIQTLVFAVLALLLLLKTDGSLGSMLLFSFVSYLFIFSIHLIKVFEQPFRQGTHSVDKVSLFVLRDFAEKLAHLPKYKREDR